MPTPERKFLLKAYDGLKPIANPLRDTYFPNVSTSNLAEIKVDTRKDGKKVALFVSPVKNIYIPLWFRLNEIIFSVAFAKV